MLAYDLAQVSVWLWTIATQRKAMGKTSCGATVILGRTLGGSLSEEGET